MYSTAVDGHSFDFHEGYSSLLGTDTLEHSAGNRHGCCMHPIVYARLRRGRFIELTVFTYTCMR